MKIKELHLRNIASIETADINFSEDLRDAVTGDPASVFLISGDTGAGKSVILDGISMALYKTTPRISGVANQNRNEFSDSSGETIRVGSIEQYTRLGISEKDESYSELVFEGNDGVEYRARLSLGMLLGNTDKATGKRALKHRAPKWEIKVGTADWSRDSVEKTILNAIGLNFEQFGRMAMLAQGQFASFLTGDKKEREAILEQLTNTEHFTAYGAAIKSLFDKAKAAQSTAQTAYDTEKDHTLSREELEQLVAKKQEAEAQKSGVEAKIKANQDTIDLVRGLGGARTELEKAETKKAGIEAAMKGDEYKAADALVRDWEATATERQRLKDMHMAERSKSKAKESEAALNGIFLRLTSDLVARRGRAGAIAESIGKQKAWLQEREDRDALYSNAAAIDVRIGNYITGKSNLAANEKQAKDEAGKTEGLRKNYADAKEATGKAADVVVAKQAEIDALTEKRRQLNPEQVNRDIDAGMGKIALLGRIKTAAGNIEQARKAADELRGKIEKDKVALGQLLKDAEAAKHAYEGAKQMDDDASRALATMEMSLDKKIVELRRKLATEHAETCPLCGQKIAELHIDEEFKGMLSPLEEMQEKTRAALRDAEKKHNDASRAFNSADGALKASMKSYEASLAAIEKDSGNLKADAAKAGLDAAKDVSGQIDGALSDVSDRIVALKAKRKEAEDLQKDINRLHEEKIPLDTAKAEAVKKENEAKTALDSNSRLIDTLNEAHGKLVETIAVLSEEISAAMRTSYPAWRDDTEAVREVLKADAKEYVNAKRYVENAKVELDKANDLIGNIEGQMKAIKEMHPDWEASSEAFSEASSGTSSGAFSGAFSGALPCQSRDIIGEWNTLSGKVQRVAAEIAGYDNTIAECSAILEAYYAKSGKKEEDLMGVSARMGEVEGARRLIREAGEALTSCKDAIENEAGKIAGYMEKLGVDKYEDVPDLEALEAEKVRLGEELAGVQSSLGAIKDRLDADTQNHAKLKAAEDVLAKANAVFAKWDKLNGLFGGTRLRTLVQTYILRPLLNNANIYLEKITDRYTLTCSEDNEQLSILVLDRYNKDQVRSVTVLSGGERFMISLALSLALSSLNRPDMNVNILFIDEGFGTLDEKNLDSVMQTLEKLREIAGESERRVGIISHREELDERIPVQIRVIKKGEGRSKVEIKQ